MINEITGDDAKTNIHQFVMWLESIITTNRFLINYLVSLHEDLYKKSKLLSNEVSGRFILAI